MVDIYITVINGYVDSYGTDKSNENDIKITLDKDHAFFNSVVNAWKYTDGELVFDENKQQEIIDKQQELDNRPSETDVLAMAIMDLTEIILGGID